MGRPSFSGLRVSTHICAGNVSTEASVHTAQSGSFNSYMSRECFCCGRHFHGLFPCFNSYMRRKCFYLDEVIGKAEEPFQLIYARGMFLFIFDNSIVLNNVSTHICAGDVSAFMRGFAILDGANPQELDCSLRVRAVIYRMR